MQIVKIEANYIHHLRSKVPMVFDSKDSTSQHGRHYIGVVFEMNNFQYFAPLSSPKQSDYLPDGSLRPSFFTIIRMGTATDFLGSIRLSAMIPVPLSQIIKIDIAKEKDPHYRKLLVKQIAWIRSNESMIMQYAKNTHQFKKSKRLKESQPRLWNAILPFDELEKMCRDYSQN